MKIFSKIVLLSALACGTAAWSAEKCEEGSKFGAISIEMRDGKLTAVIDSTVKPKSGYEDEIKVDIKENESCEVQAVVVNRTFAGSWGVPSTIMFPFAMPKKDCVQGQIYEITNIETATKDDGSLKYTVVAADNNQGAIVANRPYFVKQTYMGEENKYLTIRSDNDCAPFTLVPQSVGDAGVLRIEDENKNFTDWVFRGTFEYKEWKKDDPDLGRVYGFAKYPKEEKNIVRGQFVKAAAGAYILPLRAYFAYEPQKPQGVRAMDVSNGIASLDNVNLPENVEVQFMDENGELTGISTMNPRTGVFVESKWFDTKGRKMNQKPTTKGAFFNKGNKVLAR